MLKFLKYKIAPFWILWGILVLAFGGAIAINKSGESTEQSEQSFTEQSFGDVSSPSYFKKIGNYILPLNTSWIVGSSTNNSTFNISTSTKICLTGDTCRTTWPTSGGGSTDQLGQIGDVATTTPEVFGHVLRYNNVTAEWESVATSTLGLGSSGATVTSVDLSMPTEFAVTNNPVTTSGTLTVNWVAGYSGVKTASSTNWNTFYDTPSNRITAGNFIDWSTNTLNVSMALDDISDVTLVSAAYGDLLSWTGSAWADVATSTLKINTNDLVNGAGWITNAQETDAAHDNCSEITGCVVGAITDGNTGWDNSYSLITLTNLSSTATGLTYTNTTGVFSLTSGYVIPTSTLMNTLDTFQANPSTRITDGTGLTWSSNTLNVDTSQNIATLSNLTSNGFVKTSGGTGALSVDTNTYLTGNQTITLSGDISGSGATAITTAIGADKVTDLMIDWGTTGNQVSTADVPELTNLYYTDARADARINATTSIGTLLKLLNLTNASTTQLTVSGALWFPADSVEEADINFSTSCGSGSKLYIDGGNLACNADATGSGGAGTISTSTSPTIGQLSYWTSSGAWPETLGSVATTSLTATSPLSLSQPISVIGSLASALSLDTSGAWSGTAGSLAANGGNCSAGQAPLGVDALGAVESCFDVWTEAENTSAAYVSASGTMTGTFDGVDFGNGTLAQNAIWVGGAAAIPSELTLGTAGTILASSGGTVAYISTSTIPLLGDVTGTLGASVVGDNSHTHDSTTISGLGTDDISGLDISADTNLAITYPITLTDDNIGIAFGTTTANSWSALQQFNGNATTSNLTVTTNTWLTNLATPAGTFLAVDAAGKVISTTTPTGASQWTTIGSDIYYTTGNIGIGTTSPAYKLDVYGNIRIDGNPYFEDFKSCNLDTDADGLLVCGSDATGSGGAGTISTSTSPTIGQLPYWTSLGAWPETLGSVATTSLTATSPLSLSQPISVIGAAASALSISTAGDWTGTIDSVDFGNGTLAQNALWVGGAAAIPSELAIGTGGYILTVINGAPAWGATSTIPVSGAIGGTLGALTIGTDQVNDTHIDWGTGANQVSIADLTGNQISGALVWDFGGATSIEMVNGANPTVNATGEFAWETTTASSSLRVYDGTAERALYPDSELSFTVSSSTVNSRAGMTASSTIAMGFASKHGETFNEITCAASTGVTAEVEVGDGTVWANYILITATKTTTTLNSNNTFTMYESRFYRIGKIANLDGTEYITCTINKTRTAD